MIVRVKLFAAARQIVGLDELEVEMAPGATIADLREAVADQFPDLGRLTKHAMFAIDTDYAEAQQVVPESAEVAMIPPVSGG